jgi:hypothetical protein
MKIRPVGAELFHTDRQTDGQMERHDEANSRFSKFCASAYKRSVYNCCAENTVFCGNTPFIDAGA